MPDVTMPRLSDSMEEGTIIAWLVDDGAVIETGQDLVEIETDKATMVYAADATGPLSIAAANGETHPVGAVIAHIGVDDRGATANAKKPKELPAEVNESGTARNSTGSAPSSRTRMKASPVARRMAVELGINLASVSGSGPGGRVVRADVEAAAATSPTNSEEARKGQTIPLSRAQVVIARRMVESRTSVPEFELTVEIDMEACREFRGWLRDAGDPDDPPPTFNDMVLKACAIALRNEPRANASFADNRITLYDRVNVGFAVASDKGLLVPTIADADRKPLRQIAAETRRAAERARTGEITPAELGGATFTVSNLGMLGIRSFTAVINAPQAAILAIGAMEPRPVARDGQVAVRQTMTATLVCDHRILYGADGARLLGRIRALLELPFELNE